MDNVISLNDLFHNRIFKVPDYQRGYSWERRQVREFLEDLELLMPQRSHYTGTVVLHEPPTAASNLMDVEGKTYNPVEIVDGQQRLTTIVLLLDAYAAPWPPMDSPTHPTRCRKASPKITSPPRI